MKFQCGGCEKNYQVDTSKMGDKGIRFKCDQCRYKFYISKDLTFSSSGKNSKLICSACGAFVSEKSTTCYTCNQTTRKNNADLRVDNKDYELLDARDSKIYSRKSGKRFGKTGLLAVSLITAALLAIIALYFVSSGQKTLRDNGALPLNNSKVEIQIVIMNTGTTHYAQRIEHEGAYVIITDRDGGVSRVLERDIVQIAKAVLED